MRAKVVDRFDVKGNAASILGATGVVVIYAPFHPNDLPIEGDSVLLCRLDRWMHVAVIGEVKAIPTAPGFFIPALDKNQAPVGTTLVWGKELSPALLEGAAALAG